MSSKTDSYAAVHLVVVASGTQNRWAVYEGWPGAVYQFRPGENGADIALAQFICENNLEGN